MKTRALITGLVVMAQAISLRASELQWFRLPLIPDREGFAGMFAGVSRDVLLIAGGANFPDKRPWEGGTKVWYDKVWALERPDASWKLIGAMPRPLGYGVSITTNKGLFCVGGSNAEGHNAECFILDWNNGALSVKTLPSLPRPCANMCGALVGDTVFIAGGIEKPDSTTALHTFWSLDLSSQNSAWKELAPWPGKERMLAVSGSHDGWFYLFSGSALHADRDGKPEREWLKDAFRFSPQHGWEKLPDLPRVAVAAVSPAAVDADGLIIISGDDGSKFGFKPETEHPGFPRDGFRFDVRSREWKSAGDVPFSRATVPSTLWHDSFVIPNGEARPGYRTNEVWQLKLR